VQGIDPKHFVEQTSLSGGIACVIGAENMEMAVRLASTGGFVVHLLDSDRAKIALAKRQLAAKGMLGRGVYVDTLSGGRLPHADNLIDLVVAVDGSRVSQEEILRVLTPIRGRAMVGDKTLSKPAVAGADDWTHRLHGPDNNPVSSDTAFQMPAMLQYLGMPMQTSFQGAMLGGDGRRSVLHGRWGGQPGNR
jgi:hypothetical protein